MASADGKAREPAVLGRPTITSRDELERICLAMFSQNGFDVTSVDEIAAAAGISRRTFFRYFKSKNDVVWGDFDGQLDRFTAWFERCPADVPVSAAIRQGVLEFNTFDPVAVDYLRDRMKVIFDSPALQAYSTLRYAAWRAVIAKFVGHRMGLPESALEPRTLGHLALGAALAAYEQWLAEDDAELLPLLRRSLDAMGTPEWETT